MAAGGTERVSACRTPLWNVGEEDSRRGCFVCVRILGILLRPNSVQSDVVPMRQLRALCMPITPFGTDVFELRHVPLGLDLLPGFLAFLRGVRHLACGLLRVAKRRRAHHGWVAVLGGASSSNSRLGSTWSRNRQEDETRKGRVHSSRSRCCVAICGDVRFNGNGRGY